MFVTCKSRLSFTNLTLCKHLFFLRVDILLCKHSLNHFMKEKIISLWTILSFLVNRASQSVENPSAGFWLVCSEDTKHWNLPPVILSDTSFMLTLEDSMDLWICQIFLSRSSGAGLNQFYVRHSDDETPSLLSLSCQGFTSLLSWTLLMLIIGHLKEFIQALPSAKVYTALVFSRSD